MFISISPTHFTCVGHRNIDIREVIDVDLPGNEDFVGNNSNDNGTDGENSVDDDVLNNPVFSPHNRYKAPRRRNRQRV